MNIVASVPSRRAHLEGVDLLASGSRRTILRVLGEDGVMCHSGRRAQVMAALDYPKLVA